MDLSEFHKHAQAKRNDNEAFYKQLKRRPPKDLDTRFHRAHDAVFERTDCLQCANCCKTTSPIFYQHDIERAAKGLGIKPGNFLQTYLEMDEEGDFVLTQAPCPFLEPDNRCGIYEHRPTACREYPHTNRKNMRQILSLTFRNTLVCPAVLEITERVKQALSTAAKQA